MSDWLWKYWRPIKFLRQRLTRGWDDSDLWNLDYVIIKFIYPRLKAYRELPPAGTPMHPTEIQTKGVEKGMSRPLTVEEWDNILKDILLGFELILEEEGYPVDKDKNVQVDKSMSLFHEWFFALWD